LQRISIGFSTANFEQKMPSKVFKALSWGWPADYPVRERVRL